MIDRKLKIAKAMAELTLSETHTVIVNEHEGCVGIRPRKPIAITEKYNPIDDKALNLDLRDKYNVEIDYRGKTCRIERMDGSCVYLASQRYDDKIILNEAVCIAILKSKGVEI